MSVTGVDSRPDMLDVTGSASPSSDLAPHGTARRWEEGCRCEPCTIVYIKQALPPRPPGPFWLHPGAATYTARPTTVTAVQYTPQTCRAAHDLAQAEHPATGGPDEHAACRHALGALPVTNRTVNGTATVFAHPGDWVLLTVDGLRQVMGADAFDAAFTAYPAEPGSAAVLPRPAAPRPALDEPSVPLERVERAAS